MIYLAASMIKVIHVSALPEEHQKELFAQEQIKITFPKLKEKIIKEKIIKENEALLNNSQEPSPKLELPNAQDLFVLIKSEHITNDKYKFNIVSLPVDERTTKPNNERDDIYLENITKDVLKWNNILWDHYRVPKKTKLIKINDVKITFIKETDIEFTVDAYLKLLYQTKTLYYKVKYYGKVQKSDNFINEEIDQIVMKLVSIRPVNADEYYHSSKKPKKEKITHPFLSMEDQMKYVSKRKAIYQKTMASN